MAENKPMPLAGKDILPFPAASVMLVRDARDGIEVFMMKRNIAGAFAGLYVFPGGKINESDHFVSERVIGIDDELASKMLNIQAGGTSYWIGSLRECFEEAGILLAQNANGEDVDINESAEKYQEFRNLLNKGDDVLMQMCEQMNLTLDLGKIAYSAHWITPQVEKRRFNTRFFVAVVPPTQTADHDGQELVDSLWISPAKALELGKKGEIQLILPTISNLQDLACFDTCSELLETKKKNAERLLVPKILPKFTHVDGKPSGVMPWQPGYSKIPG